ncbi:MAG TPA: hypothetical protein VF194_15395 [Ferrovibrio sp.]|uniref:hypothetical protein n=1 Tax=Ferrovibrio sp. TaxID=1917215 RepID=UPI002ED4D771
MREDRCDPNQAGAASAALPAVPFAESRFSTPRRRRRIDWARAAGLVAEGRALQDIAAIVGIPEERFWRHFGQSERFAA